MAEEDNTKGGKSEVSKCRQMTAQTRKMLTSLGRVTRSLSSALFENKPKPRHRSHFNQATMVETHVATGGGGGGGDDDGDDDDDDI